MTELKPIWKAGLHLTCLVQASLQALAKTIIAASTVLPEEPIPVHNRDYSYFMDQFKNSFYEGKNYHELIKEQKCRYVRDVQHYLMDEFGEDDLKIHHIL